jgi:predicted nucleic acid-binding protein
LSTLVDTSVWSLALRRDCASVTPQVEYLVTLIKEGHTIVTTGLVLQELLQGFTGAKAREQIVERFAVLPLLIPDRQDHIDAAELRNGWRRRGVQVGTIDALLAHLCVRYGLTMLTCDRDFAQIARHFPLTLWESRSG